MENVMITKIEHENSLYAIIINSNYSKDGISFFTPDEFSQQLGFMKHKAGHKIVPHVHNPVPRAITYTQEVLVIKKGRLRVDFFDTNQKYIESYVLSHGDVILLSSGGHGFEVLEDLEMFEIKQGPYTGEMDKIRFEVPEIKNLNIKL